MDRASPRRSRLVGLDSLEKKHPANLSGGQKQGLAIAAALALAPALIVLDEPTSQLDPVGNRDVFQLLDRLCRERGFAIVVASHASEELAATASRVILLANGKIIADGTPPEVLGDVALMSRHDVRAPDIALAYAAAAGRLYKAPAPVTLAAAEAAFVPLLAKSPITAITSPQERLSGPVVLEACGLIHAYPDGTQALSGADLSHPRWRVRRDWRGATAVASRP